MKPLNLFGYLPLGRCANALSTGHAPPSTLWSAILILLTFVAPLTHSQSTAPKQNLVIIDHMVLYSPEAAAQSGGLAGLRPLIEHAIADANEALANSQIHARVRLVHIGPTNEPEAGSTSADLNRLKAPDDGFYDQAHALRDEHGADLVTLIIEAPNSSGVGRGTQLSSFSTPSDQIAFSIVLRRSLVGTYTLVHELGHNLGANHTRSDQGSPGLFPYSNGWIFSAEGTSYRTIMARQFGRKIGYFSNPNISFNGEATGSSADSETPADNASTINHYAPKAALFRSASHSNDSIVNAQILKGFWTSSSGSNLEASAEANEPAHDGSPAKHSVWWQWTSPIADKIEITTDGTSFPHRIAVYGGEALQTLEPLGSTSSDEFNHSTPVSLTVDQGQSLLIAIDSLGDEQGFVALQIRKDNDHFENAIRLSGQSVSSNASNIDATSETREPGHGNSQSFFSGAAKSVWWTWRAPDSGHATITTRGSSFPSMLGVYQGSQFSDLSLIAEDEFTGSNGTWRSVSFDATGGEDYRIAIDTAGGLGNTTGTAILHIDLERSKAIRFVAIKKSNNTSITLEIQGFTDHPFQLEQSEDLLDWQPINVFPPDALPLSIELRNEDGLPATFLRISGLENHP